MIALLHSGSRVKSEGVNGLPSLFERHARQRWSVDVSPRLFQSLFRSMYTCERHAIDEIAVRQCKAEAERQVTRGHPTRFRPVVASDGF